MKQIKLVYVILFKTDWGVILPCGSVGVADAGRGPQNCFGCCNWLGEGPRDGP